MSGRDETCVRQKVKISGFQTDRDTIRTRAFIFFLILGLGSLLQYVYGWALQHLGGYSYPFTSPLFYPDDRFTDFFLPGWYAINGIRDNYAPFAVLIGRLTAQVIDFSNGLHEARGTVSGILCLSSMMVFFAAGLGLLAWEISNLVTDQERGPARITIFLLIFACMFISYPVIFTIDRGNYSAVTFVFLYLSLTFLKRPLLSSFFLGTALSLKYYLGLLLFPFLQSHRYRFVLYILAVVVIENVLSSLFLSLYGLSTVKLFSTLLDPGAYSWWPLSHKIAWSSHLLNLFYVLIWPIYFVFGEDHARTAIPIIEKVYMFFIFIPGALFGPWLIAGVVPDLIGRLFYVTVLTILIAPYIGNYALTYLLIFVPYLLQIRERVSGDIATLLLALALMPKYYVTLYVSTGNIRVTLQSFITPIILLTILALPFQKRLWNPERRA